MADRDMRTRRKPHVRAPGLPPGTLAVDPSAAKPVIRAIGYGPEALEEITVEKPADLRDLRGRWPVLWVNVDGLGDADIIQAIGEVFGLHYLALEDVVNVPQRTKVEPFADHVFFVTHMKELREGEEDVHSEQISLFVGQGYVITFQERPGDCLDPVRDRLRQGRKRIRGSGADFLAYAVLDAIVDHYFPLLERISDRMEDLEEEVMARPDREVLARIRRIRRHLISVRRTCWPLRDAVGALTRETLPPFTEATRVYLRDCHDHALRIVDLVESYRDQVSGLMEGYMSAVSHRMNEVMAVLTIIATIFIPLGFIAGLYGMNFDPAASPWNMPELGWAYGYPFVLLLMLAVAGGMLLFFRWKGWLGGK